MKRWTRGARGLVAGLAAAAVAGCSSVEITAPDLEVIEEITFHPSLSVDLASMTRLQSGVYVEDLEEGTGDPAATGVTANVYWEGYLATRGNQFIQDQAAIILGVGEVPAGLDEAIRGMREGGTRRAVVPPLLGYGRFSNGLVPGGSVLVYEIELIEVVDPQGGAS